MPKSRPTSGNGSPSAWSKRIRTIVLAAVGLAVSGYLAAYQLGFIGTVWDPFFPEGSPKVLRLMAPIPDAALGGLAYLAEIVLSFIGGTERWRTMPPVVLLFGFVITAGAVVSLALVLAQPLIVGAWCTLCLVSAAISFAIFFLGLDEPRATVRHLRRAREEGTSLRQALLGKLARSGGNPE